MFAALVAGKTREEGERDVFSVRSVSTRTLLLDFSSCGFRILISSERAPDEIKDLYRADLISQSLAAKFGPKKADKAKPRKEVAAAYSTVSATATATGYI